MSENIYWLDKIGRFCTYCPGGMCWVYWAVLHAKLCQRPDLISRKAAVQYCLFSIALWIILVMRCTCSMAECFLLNPNWCSDIICVDCKMGCIRVIKSFSKPLERIGSRMIGLQDFTSSAGLPGFNIVTIWDTFRCNNQLDAQFFFMYVYFYSLHVSNSYVSIIRWIAVSMRNLDYVTLCRWPSSRKAWIEL